VQPEECERFRRDLTRLLTDALIRVQLEPKAATCVANFIDNYEFGLAYEIMTEELEGTDVPADAAANLKAAANIMGIKISN
jgi:hypothetical protein